MNLHETQAFVEVVKAGSFTQAAKRMGVPRIGKTNALWAEDLVPRIDLGAALAGHERVSSGFIPSV